MRNRTYGINIRVTEQEKKRIERHAKKCRLWQMEQRYEADVIETLENSFGELDDKSTLADAIVAATRNAVEDNMADYLADLMNCLDGSALEGYRLSIFSVLVRHVNRSASRGFEPRSPGNPAYSLKQSESYKK